MALLASSTSSSAALLTTGRACRLAARTARHRAQRQLLGGGSGISSTSTSTSNPAGAGMATTTTAAAAAAGAADAGGAAEPRQLASDVGRAQLLAALRGVVPQLTRAGYKGQSGKVGVLGGCREYAGAPYFAAMSAMRLGADLAYVFCTPEAAPAIKGYSPELIVLPALQELPIGAAAEAAQEGKEGEKAAAAGGGAGDDGAHAAAAAAALAQLRPWLARLSVLVVGPGMGGDARVAACMRAVVAEARAMGLPLLVDGSGLNVVAAHPETVRGYQACVLTPNLAEFGRLAAGAGVALPGRIGAAWQQHTKELAAALGGPVVVSKGPVDVISDGRAQLVVSADGSPRRCGGQGDVLAGAGGTFIAWALAAAHTGKQQQQQPGASQSSPSSPPRPAGPPPPAVPPLMLAAYGACSVTRAVAAAGYRRRGRSLVAEDLIGLLGDGPLKRLGLVDWAPEPGPGEPDPWGGAAAAQNEGRAAL